MAHFHVGEYAQCIILQYSTVYRSTVYRRSCAHLLGSNFLSEFQIKMVSDVMQNKPQKHKQLALHL